jgi:GT2 family glycosyltransferase
VPRKVEAFDGSAFMFRRRLLHYTYLFDPRFFFGNETVDLAERMTAVGLAAFTCPRAVVRHYLRGAVTSYQQNEKLTMIIVRNALIHTLRNTDAAMFLRTLILGICFRNIFGRMITGQSRRIAITYLKGVIMFVTQLGTFKRPPPLVKQAR